MSDDRNMTEAMLGLLSSKELREENGRLRARVAELEEELAGWKQSQGMTQAALDLRSAQWASVPLNVIEQVCHDLNARAYFDAEMDRANQVLDWVFDQIPHAPQESPRDNMA